MLLYTFWLGQVSTAQSYVMPALSCTLQRFTRHEQSRAAMATVTGAASGSSAWCSLYITMQQGVQSGWPKVRAEHMLCLRLWPAVRIVSLDLTVSDRRYERFLAA